MTSRASCSDGRCDRELHQGGCSLGCGGLQSLLSPVEVGLKLVRTNRRVALNSAPRRSGIRPRTLSIIWTSSVGGEHSPAYGWPPVARVMTRAATGFGVAHPTHLQEACVSIRELTNLVPSPLRRWSGSTARESIQTTEPRTDSRVLP
jgi:hypothetical protein